MKTSTLTRLFCIILLLLSWTNVFAQYDLGPNKLLDAPAPTLNQPIHRRINLRSARFVGRVGGVAFGATAAPAKSLGASGLTLSYRPEKMDGNRFWVIAGGREFPAKIYDWQLVPITAFADSPYTSCVTLFGELNNREMGRRLSRNGDGVINYHEAFTNKLLGLRLLQLDILIDDFYSTELISQKGSYIMGEGEAQLDKNANIMGWSAVRRLRAQLASELGVKTRSYVITDEGRDVRFSFDDGGLKITGEPYIYFWLYKFEFPGYDRDAVRQRVASETAREAVSSWSTGRTGPGGIREAYISMLLEQINKASNGYYDNAEMHPSVARLMRSRGDKARRAHLTNIATESISNLLVELRTLEDVYTVVPLTQYSERISREPGMLRRINPIVWDAGVNVMHYAAFFRYYKSKYPSQWKSFLAQLNQVTVPQVKTYTIMKRAG